MNEKPIVYEYGDHEVFIYSSMMATVRQVDDFSRRELEPLASHVFKLYGEDVDTDYLDDEQLKKVVAGELQVDWQNEFLNGAEIMESSNVTDNQERRVKTIAGSSRVNASSSGPSETKETPAKNGPKQSPPQPKERTTTKTPPGKTAPLRNPKKASEQPAVSSPSTETEGRITTSRTARAEVVKARGTKSQKQENKKNVKNAKPKTANATATRKTAKTQKNAPVSKTKTRVAAKNTNSRGAVSTGKTKTAKVAVAERGRGRRPVTRARGELTDSSRGRAAAIRRKSGVGVGEYITSELQKLEEKGKTQNANAIAALEERIANKYDGTAAANNPHQFVLIYRSRGYREGWLDKPEGSRGRKPMQAPPKKGRRKK